ncbi:MAG: hypothetical protein ACSHYB_16175 [Roseibacillus sp.]
MKRLHLILVVLIAIVIGFVSHAVQHSSRGAQEQLESDHSSSKSQRRALSAQRSREIQSLTKGVLVDGGQEEWFRWLAYLENASLSDLPQFVSLVENNQTALNLIAERWVTLDPMDCFRYLLSQRGEVGFRLYDSPAFVFSKLFFAKWIQRDLEAVAVALDSSEALAGLDDLRVILVRELFKIDLSRALALGTRWDTFDRGRWGGDAMPTLLQEWAQSDPRAALEAVFELPSDNFLAALADLWGESDPRAALDFSFGKGGDRGYRMAERAFAKWSQDDFSAASQWFSELPEPEANFLTPTLVEAWSKSDPTAALEWSQQSLTGRLRNDSIERIVIAAAFSKGPTPKDLLASIESPDAYQQAVVGLSRKLRGMNEKQQAEAISWFDDVEDAPTLNKLLYGSFANFLVGHDFERFQKLVSSPKAQTVSAGTFSYAMGLYVGNGEPEEAMNLILESKSSFIPQATGRAFAHWYRKDGEAAAAWAESLHQDDPRRSHLVQEMGNFQNESYEQVVRKLNAMPPIMRELFREAIVEKQNDEKTYMNYVEDEEVDWGKLLEVLNSKE